MDRADSGQLKQFEKRLERRLGLQARWRLRYGYSKPWLRGALQALWYVLLAELAVSAIYLLLSS